jgi:ribosome-associated translation inhibitor RaiA
MRIEVVGCGAAVAADLRSYVELRLFLVFGHLERRKRRVTVSFASSAKDHGSRRRCRVFAELASDQHVRAEETDLDYFSALDRAAGRLDLEVARALRCTPPTGHLTREH